MVKTYNLFISHSWNYSSEYEGIVDLLKKRTYFKFNDFSVPKDDRIHTDSRRDSELYDKIKDKIQLCHVVLILAGVYSTHSKWIKKEITIAKEEFQSPKKIVAVEPWAAKHTSELVKNSADKIVRWNTESIVKAIRDVV